MQQRLNVVIVEDDAIFRSLVLAMLSKETQFQVFEAASGEALERIMSQTPIDCIVLDYNLGDDNGFAIKERIEHQRHGVGARAQDRLGLLRLRSGR